MMLHWVRAGRVSVEQCRVTAPAGEFENKGLVEEYWAWTEAEALAALPCWVVVEMAVAQQKQGQREIRMK